MPSRAAKPGRVPKAVAGERWAPVQSPRKRAVSEGWTFLTNHSHVLVCLLQDPGARLRDVAERIGITERAVQKIVLDLETAKVLHRVREGRRNRYKIHLELPLRHQVEAHCTIRELFAPIAGLGGPTK